MTSNKVTQWLQKPTTDIDTAAVEAIVKSYPYFIPARYMQAAALHQQKTYTPQQLGHMRLYAGNWLLFHELLGKAAGKIVMIEEAITAVPEVTAVTQTPLVPGGKIAVKPAPEPLQEKITEETSMKNAPGQDQKNELIQPVYTEDYFRHEGIIVPDEIPSELEAHQQPAEKSIPDNPAAETKEDPKSLMVMMSFSEWLMLFRTKNQKEKEEEEDRKAMKTMWQKEKLAAALEEENDEIPENVFEMAVNSLDKDEGLVSESLAEILTKQGKIEKAIEMYRKLSLRNPQKSTYFAQQISILQKKTEL